MKVGILYMKSSNLSSKFSKKRFSALNVSNVAKKIYSDTGLQKWIHIADSLKNCGTFLQFAINPIDLDSYYLVNANFCRYRLCPMCAWRRSLKTYSHVRSVLECVTDKEKLNSLDLSHYSKYNFQFLFVTLTVKNCSGDNLSNTIDIMLDSFRDKFMKYKDIKSIVLGYYRTLEVTYNADQDTFHPHLHCLFAVSGDYFKKGNYISQDKLSKLWGRSIGVDYIPITDIRKVKCKVRFDSENSLNPDTLISAICEVSKYATKDIYYNDDTYNLDNSARILQFLDSALKSRRFIGFGGLFKDIHKKLNLSNCYDDLLDIDYDDIVDGAKYVVLSYAWNSGFCDYSAIGQIQTLESYNLEKNKVLNDKYKAYKKFTKSYIDNNIKKSDRYYCVYM